MTLNNIYVNCGGSLDVYKSKKEVMDFFEDCIMASEGSERDRYTEIYFSVKENLNTNKRCFTDCSDYVTRGNINPDDLDDKEIMLLQKNYNVTKDDLYRFRADRILGVKHKRIYDFDLKNYNSIDELYENYISKKNEKTFYIIGKNMITCIDANAKEPDKYWAEEFCMKDYDYANKWLNGDIEYEDYPDYLKNNNLKKELGVFNGEKLYLTVGRYRNNNTLYLGLNTDKGESYSDITINLSERKLSDNIAYLTNDMSNELKAFVKNKGIISEPLSFVVHNLGEYEVVYVNLDKVKEYDPKGYKDSLEQDNDIEI